MRKCIYVVQIIEEEAETSECDIDKRVKESGILLKTYYGGRMG